MIEEAEAAREAGEERVILFGLCGHGHFDLSAYDAYLAGQLEDPEFSEDDLSAALASLPEAPALAEEQARSRGLTTTGKVIADRGRHADDRRSPRSGQSSSRATMADPRAARDRSADGGARCDGREIALPSAQKALGFSNANRQWIITAYSLTFGSLLLLFGRLGDLFGRKRTLMVGLVAFAVVSAIGGAAQSFGMLVTARAFQGAAGALLAPSALSLLTTTFTAPRERGIAFGIYGAIAGAGGAVGLLLGGVLTEYLSWRWCLYVNVVIAVPAVCAAMVLLTNQVPAERPRLDVPGAVAESLGLFLIVFGFSQAEPRGWTDIETLGSLIAA